MKDSLKPLEWLDDGTLRLLDQTRLPREQVFLHCNSREKVFDAIRNLSVRGAPAIGIAGAYGLCVDLCRTVDAPVKDLFDRIKETASYLKSSRPTAVNLFWALDRMEQKAKQSLKDTADLSELREILIQEARQIHQEDRDMCQQMGKAGCHLIQDNMNVLTHCNTGYLATGGQGTALSIIYEAFKQGRRFHVFVDETRPLLQGARLTAYELQEAGVPATLICDSAAGFLMKQGEVDCVFTGADRIAQNGDTANKIGTYTVAAMAARHSIPFYIVAPSSTFDLQTKDASGIVIEERGRHEVVQGLGRLTAPDGIPVRNPAFDITDASLITSFITEKGLISPPYHTHIRNQLFAGKDPHA